MSDLPILYRIAEALSAFVGCDDCEIMHDECQSHGWFVADGEVCPNERALALIDEALSLDPSPAMLALADYDKPGDHERGWVVVPTEVVHDAVYALSGCRGSGCSESLPRIAEEARRG